MATQAQLRANDELIHIKMIMFTLVVYTKREEKIMVENTGFEPVTSWLPAMRSPN